MTRFRFDQFSKQYLEELLTPYGEVTVGKELLGEARQIDLWFTPYPHPTASYTELGLLARLSQTPCLLEAYRNPPTPSEIKDCLQKLLFVHADRQRQSKREDIPINPEQLPMLWILASSASKTLLNGFNTTLDAPNWGPGIYFFGHFLRTAIIALNQLPQTPDTLWLRLLGKGKTQKQAIEELMALSPDHSLRRRSIELLANWRITIEASDLTNVETQELFMQLSPAYLEWREKTRQEGRQEGIQEGRQVGIQQDRRATVEALLQARFGTLEADLEQAIATILQLSSAEYAQFLLEFTGLSRAELLQRLTTLS
ncbi:MAG: hypothetical protein WCD18_19780 [Thermosynechococcaceae cyanobacterium]